VRRGAPASSERKFGTSKKLGPPGSHVLVVRFRHLGWIGATLIIVPLTLAKNEIAGIMPIRLLVRGGGRNPCVSGGADDC